MAGQQVGNTVATVATGSSLRLVTLGRLTLTGGDVQRPRLLLLLAYLLLEGPQPRAQLQALFWPESDQPANNLRISLHLLRTGAPGLLHAENGRIGVVGESDALDLLEALRRQELARVRALYAGPFVPDTARLRLGEELEEWVFSTRERLAGGVRAALLHAAEHEPDPVQVQALLEAAARTPGAPPLEPADLQRLHRLLPPGGLLAHELAREARALGLVLETRDPPPPAPSLALPTYRTTFVGREAELDRLRKLLEQPGVRLVTLHGTGGVGKTRLAVQFAQQHALRWTDVVFLDLTRLTAAAEVYGQLAGHFGQPAAHDSRTAACRAVGERRVLLLLDGGEALPDLGRVLQDLLERCPGLTLLLTSTVRLRLEVEWVLPVAGLALTCPAPGEASPALRLFLDRAAVHGGVYETALRDPARLEPLCVDVNGSPLGIELASAWLAALPLETVVSSFVDRLAGLNLPLQGESPAPRSVDDVLTGGWQRLTPADQDVLLALSGFETDLHVDAGTAIARTTAEVLLRLVDHAFLQPASGGRLAWAPLVRGFVRRQLERDPGRVPDLPERYAAFYLELTGTLYPQSYGPSAAEAFARLDLEYPQVQAVLRWAGREGRADVTIPLARNLSAYWFTHRDDPEALAWVQGALPHAQTQPPLVQATGYWAAGVLSGRYGFYANARLYLERCVALIRPLNDPARLASALLNLAFALRYEDRPQEAWACLRESEALLREHLSADSAGGLCLNLINQGDFAVADGHLDVATARYREALRYARSSDMVYDEIFARVCLGRALCLQGHWTEATAQARQALALSRQHAIEYFKPELLDLLLALLATGPGPVENGLLQSLWRVWEAHAGQVSLRDRLIGRAFAALRPGAAPEGTASPPVPVTLDEALSVAERHLIPPPAR